MTLPASGPLTFSDIQTEFGGTNPIALNEYYAGGGLVPAGTTGTYGAVPSSGQISVQNFYGTTAFTPIYIEEVFSTWLFNTSTPSDVTVANGINLSGNGGLVWTKLRSTDASHQLYDTVRGGSYQLQSNTTNAQSSSPTNAMQFGSNGFTWLRSGGWDTNTAVSWTFRKQPKFFDIVTYSGNGVAGRTIAHNLGSVPGFYVVKRLNQDGTDWPTYHRSLGPTTKVDLNQTDAAAANTAWNNTAPTSSVFSVNAASAVNASGGTYVAYLFAHDAGGFGATGTDNVISCGSFTTDGSGNATVTLNYEPQWVMYKRSSGTGNWKMVDVMRGYTTKEGASGSNGLSNVLYPNLANAELVGSGDTGWPTATGFGIGQESASSTFIYVAIRRGPMKVPTVGTTIYNAVARTGASNSVTISSVGFPPDLGIGFGRSEGIGTAWYDRLRGKELALRSNLTAGEFSTAPGGEGTMTTTMGGMIVERVYGILNSTGIPYINWFFRRAPSFFDEVCYTGNGVSGLVLSHNLTVAPEFIIIKERANDGVANWSACYNFTATTYVRDILNRVDSVPAVDNYGSGGNNYAAAPTATTITVGAGLVNANASTYVAWLFATCAGVSKVGNYTGTGALQTVNCGFSSGARWVMIKRSDSTGDWYVWDSARGISSGNDPYLLLNSTAAEVTGTNYVDTTSVGFQVTAAASGTVNVSGGTYIFLAIA